MIGNLKEVDGFAIQPKHKATCHCDSVEIKLALPDVRREMIIRNIRFSLAGILLFVSSLAFPADWNSLFGIYAVTAANLVDPGESEPRDTHYRIQLKENSAKALYEAMKVEPETDECTGASAKSIGEMQCLYFEYDGTYECHFSINIAEQTIHYGFVC